MKITIDTDTLSDMDIAMLSFLAEQGEPAEEPEPEPAKKAAPAKKATKAKKADPEPEPEPDEDDAAPTMSDAVAAATQLVSSGEASKVKAALTAVGAKRVSEMKDEDIPAFLAHLSS